MLLTLAIGMSLSALAESVEIDGLYYELNTSTRTAALTYQSTTSANYSELPSAVTVPESVTYNGVPFTVTSITDRAFANCTAIESISIPGTVTQVGRTIESGASYLPFYGCNALKTVRLEDGEKPISLGVSYSSSSSNSGSGLFSYCPLEEVYIGRNITYKNYGSSYTFAQYPSRYGYSAFYNQPKLAKVTVSASVTQIPDYLFYKCSGLTTATFGESLTSIPKYAFNGCNLQMVSLPASVESIGEYAFQSNANMSTLSLGSATKSIGDYAFNGCYKLNEINLGAALQSIGDYAFQSVGSSIIEGISFTLPETLTSIGRYAFDRSGISSLTIPNSVTEIGANAFSSSKKLKSISIGSGCKTLSANCLSDCSSLSSISLAEGLTAIGDAVFANCTAIESISIPGTVTQVGRTIESGASYLPFYGCNALKTVRLEDGEKPISLGVSYSSSSSNSGSGLFSYCPLEEVYIGRNITYKNYGSSYTFAQYPQRYGYSAFYNQPKLAKVTVSASVTKIPDYLFYKNGSITLMGLPKVQEIGASAFESCSKLTTLNLGSDLATVGKAAFGNCSNVTKLTFPDAITAIGDEAFYNCSSVTEVTVGKSLKSIGAWAFYGCKSFTALILPDTFTTMGTSAFEGCTKLTVAKLGLSLTSVPDKAFKDCTSLSEMMVPATAKSIGNQAFYNDASLATITMNEGLKTIGSEVFWNNAGIMQFSIPGTVTSIGSNSFYGCTRVAYLTFRDGEGTLSINNRGCRSSKIDALTSTDTYRDRKYDYFYDCPIRFLTIGRDITYSSSASESLWNPETKRTETRASAPFVNKADLRSVKIGNKVTFLYNHLLNGCVNVKTLAFPESLKEVYSYAFANCTGLTALEFPSLQKAHDHSFYKCTELTQIDFPDNLILLDDYACAEDSKLKEVIFREESGNNLDFKIGNYTFSDCSVLPALTFPAKTSSIGDYCFYNTPLITEVIFVDSPKAITVGAGSKNGSSLFGNSRLQKLYMGRNINYRTRENGTSSFINGYYCYSPFEGQNFLTDLKFSQAGTVTDCKNYLLYNVNNCKEIILPESLTSIGDYTFSGMSSLESISIPDKVTTIGVYAFKENIAMKSAKLSTSCNWLQEGLFDDCTSLQAITIPAVVTKMDSYLFRNCKQLANVTFEDATDLLEIGYGASNTSQGLFRDCPVETLYLGRWLSYNTESATRAPFSYIPTLKNLTIGENVGVVDKYMFAYCTGLEELYLPDNIESVGMWGFRGCSALKSVRFGAKLSQVADYGFSECTSLDNVAFPASMTSIADNSFSGCTSLKTLDLGQSLNIIGPAAFKGCTALEGIEIPETLYGLGVEAFAGCTSLPSVAIKSISSVGKQAFQGCTGLKWVSLSDKTTSLGEDSFAGCSNIAYVKSYAEFPPEGLVNFVESVPTNGTLFVPETSIEYYQYSPTWQAWTDIRPINDNIMVTSIELDQNAISFKATETTQLNVTVGADDATDKGIIWRTSDAEIADVDANGLVTANAVGEATITALAADGSGVKAECIATVIPTMVESIAINGEAASVKKGRQLSLAADVLPATATNPQLIWSSSNDAIATVDEDGTVNALAAGDVTITASAADGSGIASDYALVVTPPMRGDSNDDDRVTITDAVNTASYAVGNEVKNFCEEAADVNGDRRITVTDASATVSIALEQDLETVASRSKALSRDVTFGSDRLVLGEIQPQEHLLTLPVRLDNSVAYVALQADITVPMGMSISDVKLNERIAEHHTLTTRRISDSCMRVAIFDIDNSLLAEYGDVIMELDVNTNGIKPEDITISNIIAADGEANEYMLGFVDETNFASQVTISQDHGNDILIKALMDGVAVYNASGFNIAVHTIDGKEVTRRSADKDVETISLNDGIYVVTVGSVAKKINIKR